MNLTRRVLYIAWQDPTSRRIFPVARLLDRGDDPRWEFAYIQGAREAQLSGFPLFFGLEEFGSTYFSDELPPVFANRLMRPTRPDYADYLEKLGLPRGTKDEIPILARSEGRRASDTTELFGLPTFDEVRRVYRFLFFLRGVRHVDGAEECIAKLHPGDQLDAVREPENPADFLAIRVHQGTGIKIGWVPNTLVEDFHQLENLGSRIDVFVEQVNPMPAPVQLRLLCRLEASYVESYVPFSSHRYEPISVDATKLPIAPEELVVDS